MKTVAIITCAMFFFVACNDSDKKEEPVSDDLGAARNFLQAALKGDYRHASSYMLQDSTNLGYLTVTERSYQRLDATKKDSLRTASLRFYDTKQVNDSTTITIFANSYKNDKDTLRIVKKAGQWYVDLKYLFEHDLDTNIYKQQIKPDTIRK